MCFHNRPEGMQVPDKNHKMMVPPGVAACLLMAVWTVGPFAAAATASDQVQAARALWSAPDLSTLNLTQVTSPFSPLAAPSAALYPAIRCASPSTPNSLLHHAPPPAALSVASSFVVSSAVAFGSSNSASIAQSRHSCVHRHPKRHYTAYA